MARAGEEQSQGLDDPGWAHFTLVDARKKKVKCNYCGKEIYGGITRGKQHLAGVRGEVKQCDIAPREVRKEMHQCLMSQRDSRQRRAENNAEISEELSGRLSRRGRRDNDDETGSEDSDPELTEAVERERAARLRGKAPVRSGSIDAAPHRAGPMDNYVFRRQSSTQPKIKQVLRGVKKSAESAGHAFKSVPAHAAQSEYFQPMLDAVADAGPGFKAPSRHDIYERGLQGESLHKFKNELKSFIYHNTLREYIDKVNAESQMDYLDCCIIIEDKEFWVKIARYLKVVTPLVKVLRMVDGDDKNDMGYLYEAMDRAKMELRQSLPKDYKKWWKIIDHRWENTLHHDLHAAGYYLNPRLMYADNAHVDNEVLQGTLNVIGRLSMTSEKRLEAELQMHAYRMRTGTYSDTQLQYAVGRVSPEKQPEIVEDTEEQLEPARYSESDSRPVTPRMVKPPPSLRRTMLGIYMTERANAVARDDSAIEKMKQIYVRRTPKGKGKELHTKTQGEMATSSEKNKESKTRRRRLVSYTSEDNDDDDDDPSATAGATSGGIYTQSQSDYGHDSQGDYYGHDSQGKYGQDSQGQFRTVSSETETETDTVSVSALPETETETLILASSTVSEFHSARGLRQARMGVSVSGLPRPETKTVSVSFRPISGSLKRRVSAGFDWFRIELGYPYGDGWRCIGRLGNFLGPFCKPIKVCHSRSRLCLGRVEEKRSRDPEKIHI
ncbi:hypothetical protein Taro_023536 [Colocasia esculenta]|uniref:BED-type domain-containing protein n=1 Tax=Colocasia esculenta TaxID=4460 RepID=A0A843V8L9_COLES|nr:hypothetical protein [Colocasia esculenta]